MGAGHHVFTRMGIDENEAQVYEGTTALGSVEMERRSCLVIQLRGENPDGHLWELRLQQHKGNTFVTAVPVNG
jgi:hypothetical protein